MKIKKGKRFGHKWRSPSVPNFDQFSMLNVSFLIFFSVLFFTFPYELIIKLNFLKNIHQKMEKTHEW